MGSKRLPGKVLKPVLGKPLLEYLVERLRRVTKAGMLVVATSVETEDDAIADFCEDAEVTVFRGSRDDVLDRYASAAKATYADAVVRICADCPLIDPVVVDEAIQFYLDNDYDWVGNFLERRYPRGYEVEVFSRKALDKAADEGLEADEREHVTPYLYRHPALFKLGSVVGKVDLGNQRWVVDTAEDFDLISHILSELYPRKPNYSTQDILEVLQKNPDWMKLNAHIKQRVVKGFPGDKK